jgi:uncharacterized membrane protein
MAGQKARAASGRAKSGGTTTRGGTGASGRDGSGGSGRGSSRATQANPARSGKNGRADAGPGGPGGNGGRGQDNRAAGGRPGPGRPAGPQGRAAAGLADSPAVKTEDGRFRVPAWAQWTSLVLSLAGLGVSIYLTIAHYTSTSILACSSKGYVDCAKVTTSSQSMVFGVLPVAVLGLAFYVFMVAVNSPWGWRMRIPLVWWARLGSVVVGMGFVLYLLYAEIIQIGNICLWCTSVHAITFLLFVLLVFIATLSGGATVKNAR